MIMVKNDSNLLSSDCSMEGVVLRTPNEMQTRASKRIITKLKFKDFA